uniref:SH3 domain-containing protein n=1 Tax=Enterocloster asparagiformis TaxID=333367 RepID=UPI000463C61D
PPKPAGQPGGASTVEKKKKSAAPFIIICLVLVAAMAGGTAYFVWSKGKDKGAAAQVADGGSDGWGSSDGDQKKQTEEEAAGTETTAAEKETPAAEGETEPETTAAAVETTVSDQPRPASTEQPEGNSQTAPEAGSTAPAQVPGGNGATYQTMIPLGASVSYVSTAGNGFYQVVYNGQTGYALASYLSETPGSAAAGDAAYDTMYVVNCNEFITLRTSDSTSAGEICKIPLGAAVSYVSTAGNGFYKIIYNGYTGYALASYLSY